MKPVKCLNGHFFDEDSHKTCPHCGENKMLYEDAPVPTDACFMEMDEAKARAYLEAGISLFLESGCTDEFALKFILAALAEAPLYIPVKIDMEAMFGETNLAELKKGDVFQPKQNVRMKLCLLEREDGSVIIPMFTSNEEVEKGGGSSVICVYPQEYLPLVLRMDKPVIINPFSEKAFFLPQEMMKKFLVAAVLAETK